MQRETRTTDPSQLSKASYLGEYENKLKGHETQATWGLDVTTWTKPKQIYLTWIVTTTAEWQSVWYITIQCSPALPHPYCHCPRVFKGAWEVESLWKGAAWDSLHTWSSSWLPLQQVANSTGAWKSIAFSFSPLWDKALHSSSVMKACVGDTGHWALPKDFSFQLEKVLSVLNCLSPHEIISF